MSAGFHLNVEGSADVDYADLFGLIGGRPEQVPQIYHDRSPIHKVEKIRSPIVVLQGNEDKVVPVDQAEKIVEAVKKNGQRVDYILFEGEGVSRSYDIAQLIERLTKFEQHGFRQTKNVIAALEKQHSFFCETFGIEV